MGVRSDAKVSLIAVALACTIARDSCCSAGDGEAAPATASKTPTIDQSLEWKSAFNPKISPDGKRVVYELQKTNWRRKCVRENLWIADIAGRIACADVGEKIEHECGVVADGKWIAFLSDRPANHGTPRARALYVISADGAKRSSSQGETTSMLWTGAGFGGLLFR